MDGEDERQSEMETDSSGGQGSPRAVAPRGRKEGSQSLGWLLEAETCSCDLLHIHIIRQC